MPVIAACTLSDCYFHTVPFCSRCYLAAPNTARLAVWDMSDAVLDTISTSKESPPKHCLAHLLGTQASPATSLRLESSPIWVLLDALRQLSSSLEVLTCQRPVTGIRLKIEELASPRPAYFNILGSKSKETSLELGRGPKRVCWLKRYPHAVADLINRRPHAQCRGYGHSNRKGKHGLNETTPLKRSRRLLAAEHGYRRADYRLSTVVRVFQAFLAGLTMSPQGCDFTRRCSVAEPSTLNQLVDWAGRRQATAIVAELSPKTPLLIPLPTHQVTLVRHVLHVIHLRELTHQLIER